MLEGETPKAQQKEMLGEYVIVRCRDAGVHAGELVDYEGRTVTLINARRLWYLKAVKGHTLNAVAEYGITNESKIPAPVEKIVLLEAAEIISTTGIAMQSIKEAIEHEVN